MARTNNLTNFLTDVADSIRSKTGKSDPIACEDFDTEIESISGGGSSILPNEYQQVEYIQTSGTQYINTGVNVNSNLKIDVTIIGYQATAANVLYGGGTAWGSNYIQGELDDYSYFAYGTKNSYFTYSTVTDSEYRIVQNKNQIYVNDVSKLTLSSATFTTSIPLYLFCYNRNGTVGEQGTYKMKKCLIYDNDVLVREFYPCYRKSDSVIGLYDIVNNVFYTNAGSGNFTKGNDIGSEKVYKIPLIENGVVQCAYTYTLADGSADGSFTENYNNAGYAYATARSWSAYQLRFGKTPIPSGSKIVLKYKKDLAWTGSYSQYGGSELATVSSDGTISGNSYISTNQSQTTPLTITQTVSNDCNDFFMIFSNLAYSTSYADYGIGIYDLWIEIKKSGEYLQDKELIITTNNTTTVVKPDNGYVGLNAVTVEAQVSGGGGAPIYVDTETVVGTWIDNKPLYMKTIVTSETTDSSGNFEDDINTSTSNIDIIFLGDNSYFMAESGSQSYDVNYVNITSGNVVTWNHCYPKTNGYIYTNSVGIFSANSTIQCVYNIYYTKTTDNAVSNVASIAGNHFSQTEHIVGKDLEGNTIYEQTVPVTTNGYDNNRPVNKTVAHNIANIDTVWIAEGSFFRSSATNQRFPVNYLNYNQQMYRQHAHTSVNNTNLSLYVGDWMVTRGTIYHYVTLRYTKT